MSKFSSIAIAVLTAALLVLPAVVTAQPQIEWKRTFGGTDFDQGRSIVACADGGYAIAGYAISPDGDVQGLHGWGSPDFWVIKLSKVGGLEWARALGGTEPDQAYSIIQTTDGGFAVTGVTYSNNGDVAGLHGFDDYWVVKLDRSGAIEWQSTFGGSDDDVARAIIQTSDGGYAVAGYTHSKDGDVTNFKSSSSAFGDVWLVKLDNSGSFEWEKTYGGSNDDQANAIVQTTDGGYAIAGWTKSDDGDVIGLHGAAGIYSDAWVLKVDKNGALEWQRTLGGSLDEVGNSIIQTSDQEYLVAGVANSKDGDITKLRGNSDVWLVKLTTSGSIDWQETLGGRDNDGANAVIQTTDGGYALTGFTASSDGDVSGVHNSLSGFTDVWIAKLLSTGALDWQKTLGGSYDDVGASITQAKDGGLAIAGWAGSNDGDLLAQLHGGANSDVWVIRLAPPPPPCTDIRIMIPHTELHAQAGSTVSFPILQLDSSSRAVSVLDFSIRLNTDLLTPIGIDLSPGYFAGATVETFDGTNRDSVSIRLRLAKPGILGVDTIGIVRCRSFVADELQTPITIARADFLDSNFSSQCLTSLSAMPSDSISHFTLDALCGDMTISRNLGDQDGLIFESIEPNPVQSVANVSIHLPSDYPNDARLEVYDALGNLMQSHPISVEGHPRSTTVRLDFSGASGLRYLRLAGPRGVATRAVIVRR